MAKNSSGTTTGGFLAAVLALLASSAAVLNGQVVLGRVGLAVVVLALPLLVYTVIWQRALTRWLKAAKLGDPHCPTPSMPSTITTQ